MKRTWLIALLLTALLGNTLVAAPAAAQEAGSIEGDYRPEDQGWRFILSPYAVLASQSTDVGGQSVRQDFEDISSMTNAGFLIAGTVIYDRWRFAVDYTYGNLGGAGDMGSVGLDLDITQHAIDLRLGHLVVDDVDHAQTGTVVRGWTLEANAGARYWHNEVSLAFDLEVPELDLTIEDELGTTASWWDPMVGTRAKIILNRSVLLGVDVSVGGFGLGGASDLVYDWSYTNTFKVSRLLSITAGFRQYHYRLTESEGDEELETSVTVFGPLVGVSFVF